MVGRDTAFNSPGYQTASLGYWGAVSWCNSRTQDRASIMAIMVIMITWAQLCWGPLWRPFTYYTTKLNNIRGEGGNIYRSMGCLMPNMKLTLAFPPATSLHIPKGLGRICKLALWQVWHESPVNRQIWDGQAELTKFQNLWWTLSTLLKNTMNLCTFLKVKMFSPNSWNEVLRVYKPWSQIQYHSYSKCSINVCWRNSL